LKLGFSIRQIAFIYWIFSAVLGGIALFLNSTQKFFAFISIGIIVLGALLWLSLITRQRENKE
jgi:hypothetical protein